MLSGLLETHPDSQRKMYRDSSATTQIKKQAPAYWGLVPPEKYHDVYRLLTPVNEKAFFGTVFANGTVGHTTSLVQNKSNEVLPGIYSFKPLTLAFQRALSQELNRHFPVDLDDRGFSKAGAYSSFDSLRSVSGMYAHPMSYVPLDNSLYRETLGLPSDMTPAQRTIAKNVWNIVWKEAVVSTVNVAKLSAGGMRGFTSDTQWKLAFAQWLFEEDNFEKMLKAVSSGDWLTLANEYETVYAMYLQKRGSTDDPGKVRKVFDLEYALSGGRAGKVSNADKSVKIENVLYPDFSAMRARVIQAGPWAVNCFLQICASSALKSLFDRFPKTFHINTAEEIKTMTSGKHIYCSDVTEFDRSMARDDLRIAHDEMERYWDPRIVKASWRLFTSPYYARPLDTISKEGHWVGDPRKWEDELVAGNRSGHALTSLVAKVNKVIDTLGIINLMYPVIGREELISEEMVRWAPLITETTKSHGHTKNDIKRFSDLRSQANLGRYKVEPEAGQGFSGMLMIRTGETEYDPQPRVISALLKIWCPERAIGGVHRTFWPIGMVERVNNINKTSLGQRVWEHHMKVYRDILAPEHGDFMSIIMKAHEKMNLNTETLSYIDRVFIEDPDKIHYSIDSRDVSKDVLEMLTSNVPKQATEAIMSRYYCGHIN